MNGNLYPRSYMPSYQNGYNQQALLEQTDSQISQLQQLREQLKTNISQQPQQQGQPAINQTFQLAPNGNGGIKYVNSIEDVNKETVFTDTPFFSKDLSVVWIKNVNGEIKAYEMSEIIEKDEKDLQIDLLMAQVNELKGIIENERNYTNVNEAKISTDTKELDEPVGESTKKNKSTSVSRVSTRKKEQ